MKNVVVISDSHGRKENIDRLLPILAEADYIVHLGDGAADMREISEKYPEKTYVCKGNCDFYPALKDYVLDVEGVRVFMCHGDRYRVKSTLLELAKEAKARGADLALFGHTHRAEIVQEDGVTLVNPGSLRFPAGQGGTYAYVSISKDKAYPVIVGDKNPLI